MVCLDAIWACILCHIYLLLQSSDNLYNDNLEDDERLETRTTISDACKCVQLLCCTNDQMIIRKAWILCILSQHITTKIDNLYINKCILVYTC